MTKYHDEKPMTDKRALNEIKKARRILEKHWDNGFLLGFWNEQYDGFQYRYAYGRYAERAQIGAESSTP